VEAVRNAIQEAGKTFEQMQWLEATSFKGTIQQGEVSLSSHEDRVQGRALADPWVRPLTWEMYLAGKTCKDESEDFLGTLEMKRLILGDGSTFFCKFPSIPLWLGRALQRA
jgi:hypothetical protein